MKPSSGPVTEVDWLLIATDATPPGSTCISTCDICKAKNVEVRYTNTADALMFMCVDISACTPVPA